MSHELICIKTSRIHVYTHGDCMAVVKSEYMSHVIYTNESRTHMYQYVTNLCIHTWGTHGGVSASDVRVSCHLYECITNSYTLTYISTSRTHVLIRGRDSFIYEVVTHVDMSSRLMHVYQYDTNSCAPVVMSEYIGHVTHIMSRVTRIDESCHTVGTDKSNDFDHFAK